MRAVSLGEPADPPPGVAFLDGIQRFAVEGHLGIAPVVRGYAAAGVMRREDGTLRVAATQTEEFLVAPLARLSEVQRAALAEVGLTLYDSSDGGRSHPLLDVQAATTVVEQRRGELERRVAREYLAASAEGWLVIDGSIVGVEEVEGAVRVLGLIKSHDTQFLEGADLETALTLPVGHRSSVFARSGHRREGLFTWYLRLWPWVQHDLLYGLVRIERWATADALAEASAVSRWILSERTPLAAPDERWDRLLYPIRQVETYLRAQAGGWR